jgi:D-alanyl-D-alanine carboxypeptidase
MKQMHFFLLFTLLVFCFSTQAQELNLGELQAKLDSLSIAGNFPGLSLAIVTDKNEAALVSGFDDKEKGLPLKTSSLLLQGSVGKTYVAAIALQLIQQDKLRLDEKLSTYLGELSWYKRIPNADHVTVRMLMNHTSGIMRYEFNPQFTQQLTAEPNKSWKPEELLAFVLDAKPAFVAGEGWKYSDTNYILLGMIIEKLIGKKYYELLKEKLLKPLQLKNTKPSDKRKLERLSQGYAGEKNVFGGKDKVVQDDGQFIINPQFEWTGGGIYSTTADLAKWGKLLYEGKAFDTAMLRMMIQAAVPAKLGRNSKYGLGVIIRSTPVGEAYGHSGFFPGYLTELLYFPHLKLSIAMQANSSDFSVMKLSVLNCMYRIVESIQSAGPK